MCSEKEKIVAIKTELSGTMSGFDFIKALVLTLIQMQK